jgi:hypothetical protein
MTSVNHEAHPSHAVVSAGLTGHYAQEAAAKETYNYGLYLLLVDLLLCEVHAADMSRLEALLLARTSRFAPTMSETRAYNEVLDSDILAAE